MAVIGTRTVGRSTQRSVALWVARLGLMLGAIVLLRFAFDLHAEVMREGRRDFQVLEGLRSLDAWIALSLAGGAALLFTVACRLPLRAGVSWPPIALAVIPAVLLAHLPLMVDAGGSGPPAWYADIYFFDGEMFRWVSTVLVGVAIGCGLGRPAARSS